MTHPPQLPVELLAPAGDWECARAAVANGADAIYFGLPKFNARLRANNFTEDDLPKLMDFLHGHGKRGLVAFNTLIFTEELEEAERQLRQIAEAGVDAIIVQDLGLAEMARAIAPGLALHASTQMTITSPEALGFADSLFRLDRAVLARELSLREIGRFRAWEPRAVPLEVFVHGALCVAYSGQCLTSEALGKRSANRGECAQACRMEYELLVDGKPVDLGDKRYLLSPRDLAAHQEIPELIRLGVTSFKIEGRLKSPEYVAAVTRVYRKAIDAALSEPQSPSSVVDDQDRHDLEMTFSRGFHSGWLRGTDHPALVTARYGKKRGAYVGRITRVAHEWLEVEDGGTLKPGDGVVIDQAGDTNDEQGGRVFDVQGSRLSFRSGQIDFRRVKPGDLLWKTDDPAINRRLRQSWRGLPDRQDRPLRLRVEGCLGEAMRVIEPESGTSVDSSVLLETANSHPLTPEILAKQLGRLGGTGFRLEALDCQLATGLILPLSELNALRRRLVAQLVLPSPLHPARATTDSVWRDLLPTNHAPTEGKPTLSALCRSLPQVEAALSRSIELVYADFEDLRLYRDAVTLARESKAAIFLATPRIQKPGEEGYFKLIARAEPDGVLIRNLGGLAWFRERKELRRVGDFSLNVANPISAKLLIEQGLERLSVSYDLNLRQVLELLAATPSDWLELTLHQHMPLFHMEHCVFCAFLSTGTDHTNCGRPCEKLEVKMLDRVGVAHHLAADTGCRNTLYHAHAQSGASYYPALRAAGLRHFRVELLKENRIEAEELLGQYQDLLAGRAEARNLPQRLRVQNQLGVTRA